MQIRRHSYLIHSDPDNTQAILDNFENLCGMDTKFILSKHPKIILTPWKTIAQIRKHFEVLETKYFSTVIYYLSEEDMFSYSNFVWLG